MNWVASLIIFGFVISAVLNLVIFGIYKLTSKNDKED